MEQLLKEGGWISILPIDQHAIDGRIITEDVALNMVENFNRIDYIPYIALGHDGIWGEGREERKGSITNIRYDKENKTIDVLTKKIDPEVLQQVKDWKYPHLSVEIGEVYIDEQFESTKDEQEEKTQYMLYGFALLGRVPPAFPQVKTIKFNSEKSLNNDIYTFKLGGVMENKEVITAEEKVIDNNAVETAVNETKENIQQDLFTNTEKENIQTQTVKQTQSFMDVKRVKDKSEKDLEAFKSKYGLLEQEKNLLNSRLDEKDKVISSLKDEIEHLKDEKSRLTFAKFYNDMVGKGVLLNKDMRYEEEDEKDIYNSGLYRQWERMTDIERQDMYDRFNSFKPQITENNKSFGKVEMKKETGQTESELILEKASEIAKRFNTTLNKDTLPSFIQKAMKELGK